MATISNTPRPGYVWDATDNCWYPIGTGPHSHADYITAGSAINPNIVDAKGDIIAATAADTVARLAVGSNNQVLTADSSTATGLKWAAPDPLTTKGDLFTYSTTEARLPVGTNGQYLVANSGTATGLEWQTLSAGGMTLLASGSVGTGPVVMSSIPQTYKQLYLKLNNPQSPSTSQYRIQINSYSTNYNWSGFTIAGSPVLQGSGADGSFPLARSNGTGTLNSFGDMYFPNYTSTTANKRVWGNIGSNADQGIFMSGFIAGGTQAITTLTLPGTNYTGGTYELYGVN